MNRTWSYLRGHVILFKDGQWVYEDTGEPISMDRPCKRCERAPINEMDACMGYIEGMSSVCCGHGVSEPIVKYPTAKAGGLCSL